MTSEDRCRLTYAEGKRIYESTTSRYLTRGAVWLMIGIIILIALDQIETVKLGLTPFSDVDSILTDRVLSGDLQAILDLREYDRMRSAGIWGFVGCLAAAMMWFYTGTKKAKEALKEANEEKKDDGRQI